MFGSTPISDVSLAHRAYTAVRERIHSGDLAFGDPVSRRKIARELEMSLPPVTEAFQKLEHEGLLESRPRVGTRVRIPTAEDVRGHYLVREALECQAARLFADGANARQREGLERLGAKLDQMLRVPDVDRIKYLELHERFHNQVPQATGSAAFAEAFQKTQLSIWTWISCSVFWAGYRSEYKITWRTTSHSDLASALNSGDTSRAEAAMRSHVRGGLELILKHLEPYFDRLSSNGFR